MNKLGLIFTLLFSFSVFAEEKIEYFKYEVKKADTVSDLLYELKMKPIYGPGNFLERTLHKNKLTDKKARNLEKGDVIYIPKYLPQLKNKKIEKKAKIGAIAPISSAPAVTKFKLKRKKKIYIERDKDEYDINAQVRYFNRSTRVSWSKATESKSESFSDAANTGVRLQINSRKALNASGLKIRPNYAFEYNKFTESDELTEAELTYKPGFKANLGLAIENYKSTCLINLAYQYEEMNTTDLKDNVIFSRRNYLNWAGLNISVNDEYFDKDFIHVFNVYASLKTRSSSESVTLDSTNDKLIGGKLGYSLVTSLMGLNFSADYELYMMTNDLNNYQISSFGVSVGKWF